MIWDIYPKSTYLPDLRRRVGMIRLCVRVQCVELGLGHLADRFQTGVRVCFHSAYYVKSHPGYQLDAEGGSIGHASPTSQRPLGEIFPTICHMGR